MSRFRIGSFSLLDRLRRRSVWIIHLPNGSCGGCDAELEAVFAPRYDATRLGMRLTGSPKHADVVLVTGVVTEAIREPLLRTLEMVPRPRVVVALGTCANSGVPFAGAYAVAGTPRDILPVDVFVDGCPPGPRAIIDGLLRAAKLLEYGSASGICPSSAKEVADTHCEQEEESAGPGGDTQPEPGLPSEGIEAHSH